MYYVLNWQATIAVFVVVMIVVWFLSSVVKLSKPIAILAAVGLAFLIKYQWWWIDMKVKDWMRLMGLEI
jgi:glycerol-3-phosphate acyltransferase PlsY